MKISNKLIYAFINQVNLNKSKQKLNMNLIRFKWAKFQFIILESLQNTNRNQDYKFNHIMFEIVV